MKRPPPIAAKPIKTLTAAQASDLLTYTTKYNHTAATLFALALQTGARLEEAISLETSDVLIDSQPTRELTIRAEIAKRESERTIPLTDHLQTLLALYHTQTRKSPTLQKRHTKFFTHPHNGHPLTKRTVQRWTTKYTTRGIGQATTFHTFRHTFADNLRRKTDLPTLQKLLGHRHLASTQRYTHPTGEDLRNAINQAFTNP